MIKNIYPLIIFISFFSLIVYSENKTILNATKHLNVSYIKEEVKHYEKEYLNIYTKSSRKEELLCNKLQDNIDQLQNIKKKLVAYETDMDEGMVDNMEFKEFLDIRGDLSFSIRNVQIIINKLNKRKKTCIKDEEELKIIKDNIKSKATNKNEDEIIQNINDIIKKDNDL